ncbi:MAG: hypothetical protein AAF986_06690, partial [Pseudomonadota bacterium]
IMSKDFSGLGEIAEANALAMHATMMAARPSLSYLMPESWRVLEAVIAARHEGHHIYATMDAGANVKLLFLKDEEEFVHDHFRGADLISPFA